MARRATSASPRCASSSARWCALTTYANDPAAHERRRRARRRCRARSAAACSTSTAAGRRWSTACASAATARRGDPARPARASTAIASRRRRWRVVRLADGTSIEADAVRHRGRPRRRAALLDGAAPAPLRAAGRRPRSRCAPPASTSALARLPQPRATFALGIDRPLYLSVHSAVAALAPAGGAMIHVAKYLGDRRRRAEGGRARARRRCSTSSSRAGASAVVAAPLPARHDGRPTTCRPPPSGGLRGRPGRRPSRAPTGSTSSATGSAPRACSPTPAWRAPAAPPRRSSRRRARAPAAAA